MDTGPRPRAVADVDRELEHGFHRVRWILAVAVAIALIAAMAILGILIVQDEARISASCSFWKDLGTAVLPAPSTHPQVSSLGVKIISDSRNAWRRTRCAGSLPPPSPALVYWAGKLNVPVR